MSCAAGPEEASSGPAGYGPAGGGPAGGRPPQHWVACPAGVSVAIAAVLVPAVLRKPAGAAPGD